MSGRTFCIVKCTGAIFSNDSEAEKCTCGKSGKCTCGKAGKCTCCKAGKCTCGKAGKCTCGKAGKCTCGKARKFPVITSLTCVFFEEGNIFDLCTYRLNYDIRVYMSNNRNLVKFNDINKKKHNVFNGYYIDDRPTSYDSNYVKEFIKEKIKSFNCEVYAKEPHLENLFFNEEIKINSLANFSIYDHINDKSDLLSEARKIISAFTLNKVNKYISYLILEKKTNRNNPVIYCLVYSQLLLKSLNK
jgi:hypothetical protein